MRRGKCAGELDSSAGSRPRLVYNRRFRWLEIMTTLDVVFPLLQAPRPEQLQALGNVYSIYGIRRIDLDEKQHRLTVEIDATRLTEKTLAGVLRQCGIHVGEPLHLTQV